MALIPTDEDLKLLLKADCHRGSEQLHINMEPYVFKKASDSKSHVFDLNKTWQKIHAAALLLVAIKNPKDICLVSSTPWGKRSTFKFSQFTNSYSISGRFIPGTFTNQICKNFREPNVLIVCDPSLDFQPIKEASYMNIPVIACCDTDSSLEYVDVAIPCNNKSKYSIAVIFWLLCREVSKMSGKVNTDNPWTVTVDLFIYKEVEELEKLIAADKKVLEEKRREEDEKKRREGEEKRLAAKMEEPTVQQFEESYQDEYERSVQATYEGGYAGDYDREYEDYRAMGQQPADIKAVEHADERRDAMSSKEAIDSREATEMKEEMEMKEAMERNALLERRDLRDLYPGENQPLPYATPQESAYRMAASRYSIFPQLAAQDAILPRQSTIPSEKMIQERIQQERISQERMQRERMNYPSSQYYNYPHLQRGFQDYYQTPPYEAPYEHQMAMRPPYGQQQPPFRQDAYSRAGFAEFGAQGIKHGENPMLNYPTQGLPSCYNPYTSQGQSFGQSGQYRLPGAERQLQPRQGNFYAQGEMPEQRRQSPQGGFRPGPNVPSRQQGAQ